MSAASEEATDIRPCTVCGSATCDEVPVDFEALWEDGMAKARSDYDRQLRENRRAFWARARRAFGWRR